jgi:7tm Chemosensory receptor
MCKNVYELIRPLHVLAKLLGFNVFSFRAGSTKVVLTRGDALFALFNMAYTVMLNFLYWETFFYVKIFPSEIIKSFFPIVTYVNFAIYTCAKVWNFSKRHKFGEFMKLLHDFDEELAAKFDVRLDFRAHRRFIVDLMLAMSLSQFVLALLTYSTSWYYQMDVNINLFLFSSYGFIANCILVNQFITSVSGIRSRYQAMYRVVR